MNLVANRINLFLEYVAQNLTEPMPTAEAIAQEILMSRSTLFRLVDKELGMSPFQYIRQAKLEKAKELLEAGQFNNIREMSFKVGYVRTDYFTMIFRDAFDIDLKDYFKQAN